MEKEQEEGSTMPEFVIIEVDRRRSALDELLTDPARFRRNAFEDARREVLGLAPRSRERQPAPVSRIPRQRIRRDLWHHGQGETRKAS